MMEMEILGRSGLNVSRICLGTMMFGDRTDEATSADIIAQALDAGVNFIDTADAYNDGVSEEIVGRALGVQRRSWILATKVGNVMPSVSPSGGLSRRWLIAACEDSLRRLGTDYIDIYYLHREDLATPLEETVLALGALLQSGKIRAFGLSNFRAWRVAEVCNLCDRHSIPRPVVSQPYYNALNRMPEVEHLTACDHYGLGVVPYSPLARGVLTAKYQPGADATEGSRAGVSDMRMMQTEWRPESLEIAQRIQAHTEARGQSNVGFAVRWLLNNRHVTSIIAGPRTISQWQSYLAALEYPYNEADEALMDTLVAPGHPSTPGYSDPAYPIEGRIGRLPKQD